LQGSFESLESQKVRTLTGFELFASMVVFYRMNHAVSISTHQSSYFLSDIWRMGFLFVCENSVITRLSSLKKVFLLFFREYEHPS